MGLPAPWVSPSIERTRSHDPVDAIEADLEAAAVRVAAALIGLTSPANTEDACLRGRAAGVLSSNAVFERGLGLRLDPRRSGSISGPADSVLSGFQTLLQCKKSVIW